MEVYERWTWLTGWQRCAGGRGTVPQLFLLLQDSEKIPGKPVLVNDS